uniref:Ig-like domain-containing protein n=1 Tax=Scleropages formosus TaxID=113540 RepID=A0A8C9SMD0_SCLFO
PWSEMFPGDTVTLTCHINGSGESLKGWNFTWSRMRETDQGQYQCIGRKESVHFYTLTNITGDRPQAVLTQDPPFPVLFTGENVTLKCEIKKGSQWKYSWGKKNQQNLLEKLTSKYDDGHQTYRLQSVTVRDSGQAVTSPHSNSLLLTVYETPPKLQIPMETPSEDIYTGERLTLTCTVDGDSTGWKYLWYKDTQRTELSNIENDRTDGSSYTISSAAPSHSGQYWCRAHRGGFYSHYSDSHKVNIQVFLHFPGDRPQAAVIQTPPGPLWFTGETVILTCDIRRTSGKWRYSWAMKNKQGALESLTPKSKEDYTISSAAPSHSGQYWCRAHRGGFYSHYSDSHKVNIQGEDLMNNLPTKVTLSCDVQGSSTRWVYKWYRDGQEIPISGDGDTYTILSAARSHSGQYQCRGELPERAVTSPHSHSLNLTVYGTVLLSYFVFIEDIYTGERLTLTCTVDGDSTGWKYLWYKDTQGAVLSNTDSDRTDGSSYTISSAAPSHSGQYWCRAHRGEFYSHYSDSHKVNIQGKRFHSYC